MLIRNYSNGPSFDSLDLLPILLFPNAVTLEEVDDHVSAQQTFIFSSWQCFLLFISPNICSAYIYTSSFGTLFTFVYSSRFQCILWVLDFPTPVYKYVYSFFPFSLNIYRWSYVQSSIFMYIQFSLSSSLFFCEDNGQHSRTYRMSEIISLSSTIFAITFSNFFPDFNFGGFIGQPW